MPSVFLGELRDKAKDVAEEKLVELNRTIGILSEKIFILRETKNLMLIFCLDLKTMKKSILGHYNIPKTLKKKCKTLRNF